MSVKVTIKELLEAGFHFGHQTRKWNPKMAPYIFAERNGIHIINLEKTLEALKVACDFIEQLAKKGQSILLVGTKKQAQEVVQKIAEASNMPYVNQRWLGGMLTNFETVRKSIHRLEVIEEMEKEGGFQFITKKEVNHLKKEREKLVKVLTGIRNMKRLPGALFVFDPMNEQIAVREARKLNIPIISLVDTNCDPTQIDYVIPGNDDAIRAITLMSNLIQQSIQAGKQEADAASVDQEETEVDQSAELAVTNGNAKAADDETKTEKVADGETKTEKVADGETKTEKVAEEEAVEMTEEEIVEKAVTTKSEVKEKKVSKAKKTKSKKES